MASRNRQNSSAQPVVTFIVIITFGVILAVSINDNEDYRAPIILLSFLLGLLIAGLELRALIRTSKETVTNNDSILSRDEQVARYVADLFEDDIPFDEIQETKD